MPKKLMSCIRQVKAQQRKKGVKKVNVRVEKPGAVRFADSVGVEIERSNPEN